MKIAKIIRERFAVEEDRLGTVKVWATPEQIEDTLAVAGYEYKLVISNEALEAAAKALWFAGRDGQEWLPGEDPLCDMMFDEAYKTLSAAMPFIKIDWKESRDG